MWLWPCDITADITMCLSTAHLKAEKVRTEWIEKKGRKRKSGEEREDGRHRIRTREKEKGEMD